MRLAVLGLTAGVLALSACAKIEKDDGACTQSTLDSYNNIVTLGLGTYDNGNSLTASCQKIQSLLNGRSCKAQRVSSGEEFSISYAAVQKTCDPLINKNSNSSTPVPAPKKYSKYIDEDGRCTEAYKSDIKTLRNYLKKSIQHKSKDIADSAFYHCAAMRAEFYELSCKTYDAKGTKFVVISGKAGELPGLCSDAKRLSERFSK